MTTRKRPWETHRVYGAVEIYDADNNWVLAIANGQPKDPDSIDDAELIVRAVNAYDALVAQRDALVEAGSLSNRVLKALKAYDRRNELGLSSYIVGEIGRAIEANEAALALAKEAQCTGS